jgi:hypothetical protein
MNKLILCYLLLLPFAGFAQKHTGYPVNVEATLKKAGKNREELEKVITYCRKTEDRLKLKAAYFLIANMDIHYSMDYYWEDISGKRVAFSELNYPNLNAAIAGFAKVKAANHGMRPHPYKSEDLTAIKADFLIQNIDHAFSEWRNAADYRNIPFEDFCEYLLPYRVSVEPLQPWRQTYSKEFSWITDKYKTNGLAGSLTYVSTDFRSWFANTFSWGQSKEPLPRLGAGQLLFRKKGPCEDIADLVVFAMRSQGIPAAANYVPYWATSTSSHFMNSVFDGKMLPVAFDAIGKPPVNNILAREPSKVLRLTYSKQPGTIAGKENINNIPPGFMRTLNYIDVTKQFWTTGDLNCKLFTMANPPKYTYVCVFNGLAWQPTWWAETNNNNPVFKNMAKGVVFLPVYYVNGRIKPAGYPVAEGYHHELILSPDTVHKQVINIKEENKYLAFQPGKSYKLFYWNNSWKLLAKKTAGINIHELSFINMPRNALFLLLPEYSEKKERPFMVMDDGKVKWW